MKAIFWVALVALVLSLAQCSTACTVTNRRNTKWIGLPGPSIETAYVLETHTRVLRTSNLESAPLNSRLLLFTFLTIPLF